MGARDLVALLLLGAIWGSSFLFIRVAVPALGPFVLMELRVGLAAAALALLAVAVSRLSKLRFRWKELLILGAVNAAIPFSLIAGSEINLTASLAAILNATTALFAAVVTTVWMGEALTRGKVAGLVMGVVGVAVLVGWTPIALNGVVLVSVGASLVAAFSYALGGGYVDAGDPLRAGPRPAVYGVGLPVVLLPDLQGRPNQDPHCYVSIAGVRGVVRRPVPGRAGWGRDMRGPRYHTVERCARHRGPPFRKGEIASMTENSWSRAGLSELPAGFWPRMLALWGLTAVPFFSAFDGETVVAEAERDAASVRREPSACSGRGRASCRTRRR